LLFSLQLSGVVRVKLQRAVVSGQDVECARRICEAVLPIVSLGEAHEEFGGDRPLLRRYVFPGLETFDDEP
jgi:hypothetical protein